jgi:hypothetical protein
MGAWGVKDNWKRRNSRNILLCVITLSRGMKDAPIRAPKFLGAMMRNLLVVMSCHDLGGLLRLADRYVILRPPKRNRIAEKQALRTG